MFGSQALSSSRIPLWWCKGLLFKGRSLAQARLSALEMCWAVELGVLLLHFLSLPFLCLFGLQNFLFANHKRTSCRSKRAPKDLINTPLIPGPPPAGKMAAWVPWRWRAGCFTSQDCGITTPSWTNCFQLFKSLCLSDSVHRFVASDFLDDSWYSTLDEAYDPAVGVLANALVHFWLQISILCISLILNFFAYMGVSKNRGTPKSSILIGFSITNHPFWVPLFSETSIYVHIYIYIHMVTPPQGRFKLLGVGPLC